MNKEEYHATKKAFEQKFPLLLNEKTHFRVKLGVLIIAIIVFIIVRNSLPVFDISCVQDNVFVLFKSGQKLFNENSILFSEFFVLLQSLFALLFSCYIWYEQGKDFRFPISLFLFFILKYFVDLSVKLKVPSGTLCLDLPLLFLNIPIKSLFFSNCDPYFAFNLYFLTYVIKSEFSKRMKNSMIIGGIICFIFVIFIELTIRLNHSFAMSSALIIFVFCELVSEKLSEYIKKHIDEEN